MSLRNTVSMQQSTGHSALTVSLTAVIAAGLTSATIAAITSMFGWPGTLIGVAFSAMVTSTTSEVYKAYLGSVARRVVLLSDRPPPPPLSTLADRPPPPPLHHTSSPRRRPKRIQVLTALKWFSFRTSPEKRRAILSRGLQFGVVASIIGIGIITAIEIDLGGNLPCALWSADCSPVGINPPSILAPFYTICRG
jgi:hypothetical protein